MARKTADDRKAEIVATALRLADELGPDRLTVQAVADAVGLTQPAIFRHFASKQALWLAVADAVADQMTAAWGRALADATDPIDRLEALVSVQFAQIAANPAIPALLHSHELQTENARLRQRFTTLMTAFRGHLLAELTQARDAGLIRADLAPADGATLLISLIQGVAIRWSLGNRGFALVPEGMRLFDAQMAMLRTVPVAGGVS
ncbi:TetR/AcrR family transcriptional regulator [Roseivivax sp. CAU 1753]